MTNDEKLVYMANQIARNFEAMGHDHAIDATADHLNHFWDPRMKSRIIALSAATGDALMPTAAAAIVKLNAGDDPAPQTRATRFAAAGEAGGSDAG